MTTLHSSTTDDRDPLTVRTVDEAITLAPYLLGFQPSESLVLIVADDGATCQGFVARVDLDDVELTLAMDAFASRVVSLAGQGRTVILAFTEDQDRGMAALALAIRAMEGMNISDAAWTDGESWSSIFGDERSCGENHPYIPAPEIAAEAVYRGLTVLPSRTNLVDQLSGPGRTCDPGTRRLITNARRRLSRISPLDPSLDLEGLTNGQSTLGWWNEAGVVLTGEALQRYGIRPPSLHPQQAVLFKAVALS